MALSGNFSTNKYNSTIGLKLSWTGTQSIANNTTTIKWTLTSNGGSTGQWWMAAPITVTIGGKTVYSKTDRFKLYGGGAFKKTGSIAITHNDDGTKSCAMSIKAAIYSASVNCTGSKTFTLDKINRCALISSASDFNDEGNGSLEYYNPDTSLATNVMARIKWLNGSTEEYTSWVEGLTAEQGTVTFNLGSYRSALRNACPDSNTLPVTYELKSTINGTDYTVTKAATMSIVNADPVMGALSYDDANPDIVAITGSTPQNPIIVQKQSTLRISFAPATPQKGARISSYSINFNGILSAMIVGTHDDGGHFDFVKPDFAGTYDAILRATDTRGNVSISTISVTITAWQMPTADVSLERINGFEKSTILHVDASISTVAGSLLKIQEKHRIKGGTWSALDNVPNNTDVTIALDNQYEWEMQVHVSDAFATVVYIATVGKGIPILFIDTDMQSVSFNGFPDDDEQFMIGGHLKLKPNDTDEIVLPHKYSDTEQIVGYWLDGSPIYERTVDVGSVITINADSYVSISTSLWDTIAIPVSIIAYRNDSTGKIVWDCLIAQINQTTGMLYIHSTRNTGIAFNIFTIQYMKIPQA